MPTERVNIPSELLALMGDLKGAAREAERELRAVERSARAAAKAGDAVKASQLTGQALAKEGRVAAYAVDAKLAEQARTAGAQGAFAVLQDLWQGSRAGMGTFSGLLRSGIRPEQIAAVGAAAAGTGGRFAVAGATVAGAALRMLIPGAAAGFATHEALGMLQKHFDDTDAEKKQEAATLGAMNQLLTSQRYRTEWSTPELADLQQRAEKMRQGTRQAAIAGNLTELIKDLAGVNTPESNKMGQLAAGREVAVRELERTLGVKAGNVEDYLGRGEVKKAVRDFWSEWGMPGRMAGAINDSVRQGGFAANFLKGATAGLGPLGPWALGAMSLDYDPSQAVAYEKARELREQKLVAIARDRLDSIRASTEKPQYQTNEFQALLNLRAVEEDRIERSLQWNDN